MAAELKSLPIAPTSKTDIAQSLDEDVQSSSAAPKAEFKLMSSDKTVYFLPREYLHISKVLRDELNSDPDLVELELPSTPDHAMHFLIMYLKEHKGKPGSGLRAMKPLPTRNLRDAGISEWDKEFITSLWSLSNTIVKDLLCLAQKYEIQCLVKLACACIVVHIRGKPTDKIPEILKLRPVPDSFKSMVVNVVEPSTPAAAAGAATQSSSSSCITSTKP